MIRPLLIKTVLCCAAISGAAGAALQAQNIYDFNAESINGQTIDFKQYKGKVLLIVNTASKCGFTPQLEDLEALNRQYKDQGLVIIGFPCNQFAKQDPGSNSEIAEFCRLNYGVTFQMMSKIDVNGENEAPIYTFLKANAETDKGKNIKWNFTKFLISRDGSKILRYGSAKKPKNMVKDIEKFLSETE